VFAWLLIGAGLLAVAQGAGLFRGKPATPTATALPPTATPLPPSPTSEPLIPSRTPPPSPVAAVSPSAEPATPAATASRTPAATASQTPTAALPTQAPTWTPSPTQVAPTETRVPPPPSQLYAPRQRVGVVAPQSDVARYDVASLGAGWYLTGGTNPSPPRPGGMEFAQLVQVAGDTFQPSAGELAAIARAQPGALWLVGNEPDVIWQDNATPQQYARVYHAVYQALKAADPTCQVAIGGIAQVTPLRLRYLDAILAAYQDAYGQPMPVDVWNIHLAILREERGSWGVDIPPGLPDDRGVLYEIGDNARVKLLKDQVWTFRRWMKERGLRDKPLIVTEFSVLMPPEYGFPFETVRDFMLAAFDFLTTASDEDLGLPADGNRLVQRWAWYSVADQVYSTGNLFDPETGRITPLGRAFAGYAASLAP
jgi:hypothetical protein